MQDSAIQTQSLGREELIHLRYDDNQEQYTKDGKSRMVLNVKGKGAKDRVVPVNEKLARRLLDWQEITGDGLIARSSGRMKQLGESISAIGVFIIVRRYGKMIDRSELASHDLRPTYEQLGFDAGVPLPQISTLLGHATVATMQRYLNLELDL